MKGAFVGKKEFWCYQNAQYSAKNYQHLA